MVVSLPQTYDDILDMINKFDEQQQLHEFMQDKEIDTAMGLVLHLMQKPDVPLQDVDKLIVKLQALATKFAMNATIYKTIAKGDTDNRYKKDVYYTMRDAVEKLVDALKYIVKTQDNKGFR